MTCPKLQIGAVITSNPQTVNIYDNTRANYMRLVDYSFYTNDTIINQYNNVINVNGTDYALSIGNYNNSGGSFASYLSSVIPGVTVNYDQNITGKFSFVFSGAYTLSVASESLRRILGLANTTYSGGAGTLTADYPAHFTNSDYYYINISEGASFITYTPNNPYTYVVSNNVPPGSLLKHRSAEMLPIISNRANTLTELTITVRDQYGNLVPNNGSTWYFYIDIYDLSSNGGSTLYSSGVVKNYGY